MKAVDFGATIVVYNFIIGVLLMTSSEKLGAYAGNAIPGGERVTRFTRLSIFTFGAAVAVLAASVYIAFDWLRIGIDT